MRSGVLVEARSEAEGSSGYIGSPPRLLWERTMYFSVLYCTDIGPRGKSSLTAQALYKKTIDAVILSFEFEKAKLASDHC